MVCLVLVFPPKVNGVYEWFTHMHENAASRGGLYCLYFYLECLLCSMSCRDGSFGVILSLCGCFSLINLIPLKKTVFIF